MSNRTSVGVEQLKAQVPGSVESMLKELLVVRQLVRAGSRELVQQWLSVEGIGRELPAVQLVPVRGCASRSFGLNQNLGRVAWL